MNHKNVFQDSKVVLEEYLFEVKKKEVDSKVLSKVFQEFETVKDRIVIVDDNSFADFMKYSTEIAPRIRIGAQDVVDEGNGSLWYEENVPAETWFYNMVDTEGKIADNYLQGLDNDYIELGGSKTIGKGMFKVLVGGEKK